MASCRSCDAPIEWALTPKGANIPLDAGTVPNGNLILDDAGIAHVVSPGDGDRLSHFVTCPNAEHHRRRGHGSARP